MYTKEEKSRQREAFWTSFGKYLQPILSAEGVSINWVNYKTGIPGIQFKMDADHQQAVISIVFSHKDAALRALQYDRLLQMKSVLEESLEGETWHWQQEITDDHGKPVSAVSKVLSGVNIHRKEDWPQMITFLKQRIIALDSFWSMGKYGFEEFV